MSTLVGVTHTEACFHTEAWFPKIGGLATPIHVSLCKSPLLPCHSLLIINKNLEEQLGLYGTNGTRQSGNVWRSVTCLPCFDCSLHTLPPTLSLDLQVLCCHWQEVSSPFHERAKAQPGTG